jgi:flagellin
MSSLLTNNSAMVALQTLRSINMSLDQTNNRVSTGLKVNSAADNAAYWSIATTVRSDNGALGAVQDSLGVGKSTVDTVTTGLDTIRAALQKVKEKLVTASAPEVDRGKLQTEIASLLESIRSVSDNTVSGGESWLSVDSSGASYNASKTVSAGFSRTGDTVQVSSITIDTSSVKLFDDNATVHTAVDAAVATAQTAYDNNVVAANAVYDAAVTDSASLADLDTADATFLASIATADATFEASAQDAAAITARNTAYANANTARNTDYAAVTNTSADVEWRRDRMDAETIFYDSTDADFLDTAALNVAYTVAENTKDAAYAAAAATRTAAYTAAATIFEGALNTAGADELGILDKTRVATASNAQADAIAVSDIDISTLTGSEADLATIANYLQIVDDALSDMTDSSTLVGAATARIDSQVSFVKALIDANTRAIGTLVDANMEEESTKLKALQTQQQLAVQSLSIANANSENILLLFRN